MGELRPGPVKGWKCFDQDLKCRGMQYAVGGTYEVSGTPRLCHNGLHFHEQPHEIFSYYANSPRKTRVCEVIAYDSYGEGDKSVARRLEVVREFSFFEICRMVGDGYGDGYKFQLPDLIHFEENAA